ncbi:prefoldin subunit alpha [Candidatus Woesearchaeota archaeon]|nr:prefoldin subunit alpha [Candidatus Woesearchaeota archaeon]|tara:strand:+ start:255 stop:668 length:414 start_codon:yes stop_codon:yes gene_type:complete
MAEKNEEAAKEKYMELKVLEQRMTQTQEQLQQVAQQVNDVQETIQHLEELKKVKPGTELYVPVASGIFIPAKMGDPQKLLVNVGNSTVVDKTAEQSKKLLQDQAKEMEKLKNDLTEQLHKLAEHAQAIQGDLRKLIE